MKKTAILFALMLTISGCAGGADVDELISARELPEYGETVNIEVSQTDDNAETNSEVITIDE